MCRSVDVGDLQEKVQEIGLAVAITLFLVNRDKKNCWSVLSISAALCNHAVLSSKGQASSQELLAVGGT